MRRFFFIRFADIKSLKETIREEFRDTRVDIRGTRADIGKLHGRLDNEIRTNQELKTLLTSHLKTHDAFDAAVRKSDEVELKLKIHLGSHKTYRKVMGTIGTAFASVVGWTLSKIPTEAYTNFFLMIRR